MPKASNQKLKLLYLKDYFETCTDEEHPTTVKQIIAHLNNLGISCERKTVYDDVAELERYGLDIIKDGSKYYLAQGQFELTEVRLLIDAISTSRFLTSKKTERLIEKLTSLASVYDKEWLKGRIYNTDSFKNLEEQIYYNMFSLHQASIRENTVCFKYWRYNLQKEKTYKKPLYTVAPYMFTYNDGNYYLVAMDMEEDKLKTFRVDRIEKVEELKEKAPKKPKDIMHFVEQQFSMFDGETERVRLRFTEEITGVIIDKFGKDAAVKSDKPGFGVVDVKIKVSSWFYGWIFSLGKKIEIVSPAEIRRDYQKYLNENLSIYDD